MSRSKKPHFSVYSDADFQRIADAVRKQPADIFDYRQHFEDAATWHRLALRTPERIPPSKLNVKLTSIAKTAQRLLHHLGVDDVADASDGPENLAILDALASVDGETEDSVTLATARIGRLIELFEAIHAARDIERLAAEASKDTSKLGTLTVADVYHGDRAINDWLGLMLEIYRAIMGKVGTSVGKPGRIDEGIASGPLVRFLDAAALPINGHMRAAGVEPNLDFDSDAWRSRVRTLRKHDTSEN